MCICVCGAPRTNLWASGGHQSVWGVLRDPVNGDVVNILYTRAPGGSSDLEGVGVALAGWGLCLEVRQLDVKSAERFGWRVQGKQSGSLGEGYWAER